MCYCRFKINLETNKLKAYIDVILEILKKNVNPDILVVRRYKSDDKSVPQSITCVPSLLNDNVYEPGSADISKVYSIIQIVKIYILMLILKQLFCLNFSF